MKKSVVLIIGSFIVSCAHHRDVRPGVDGLHRVVIQTEGDESQKRDALAQAEYFCKKQGKYAAIVDEKQNYTGSMDEKTYQTGKTVTKVASVVGGGAFVFGGKREKSAGGIGLLGSQAADAALGNAYTVEMKFKCM